MNVTGTAGAPSETVTLEDVAAMLRAQQQKIDEIYEVFAEHRPAIVRAAALMDPGAAVRSFTGRRRQGRAVPPG